MLARASVAALGTGTWQRLALGFVGRTITLLPGDVILTGTPSGVRMGRTPPPYEKDGDRFQGER